MESKWNIMAGKENLIKIDANLRWVFDAIFFPYSQCYSFDCELLRAKSATCTKLSVNINQLNRV